MTFLVLEGFSGTGKTTLARHLEERGWLRLQESAHALPDHVPVAEHGDTYSDYSLLGTTLAYSSAISRLRKTRDLVSEGYLLSDLAYAKIRFELKKSTAYRALLTFCREVLKNPEVRPDLYIILEAQHNTPDNRPVRKDGKARRMAMFSRAKYYAALAEVHKDLGELNAERVYTDSDSRVTLKTVLALMKRRNVFKQ
ncbi:MAG: hypothetical protein ABSB56_07230 [Nitrososphaerales archaeon]|jgi:deoxyadenosine/deoxycytidine kinase